MIALPSIAFGGFSGSAKDVTARQVGGRSILTCRTWPTGPSTNAQVARRASLKKIAKSWQLLTNDQRLDWDRLAEGATGITVLGQKAKISGLNLYVRLNSNLVMSGGAMRSDAPAGLDDVPLVRFGAMYVNSSSVLIEQIDEPDSDLRLIVKMSGAQIKPLEIIKLSIEASESAIFTIPSSCRVLALTSSFSPAYEMVSCSK